MCGRKLNSELRPQMVVTVVHEWVIKAECDFPLTGIMLAGPRSVASTAAETIKAYTVNLLCCPPLSLRFTVTSHLCIFFLDFTSCSTCCNGRYGGMPSGEKRQVAFRENYMQLKESSVYTPDCSSWWSEQKTKRGEPSCCSPAALLILSAPSISLTRLGFGVTRSLNRNSTSGQIFSELKRLFLQSMFLTCTFSICGDQRFKPPWY